MACSKTIAMISFTLSTIIYSMENVIGKQISQTIALNIIRYVKEHICPNVILLLPHTVVINFIYIPTHFIRNYKICKENSEQSENWFKLETVSITIRNP